MNEPTPEDLKILRERHIREVADTVSKDLALQGRIVEGGWRAMEILLGLTDAPKVQREEMRKAYFFGAQHLFATLVNVMDKDAEPTEQDIQIMQKVSDELENFVKQYEAQPRN